MRSAGSLPRMPRRTKTKSSTPEESTPAEPEPTMEFPVLPVATSAFAEVGHSVVTEPEVEPRTVERGVVVFDLDGTILDDVGLISHVAADVFQRAFGTPPEEGRIHYLATTGMPFEAQLAQLYPEVPAELRVGTARIFHERKVKEAYAHSALFPDIPRVLRQLSQNRWTLVISTGAERETADLLLEREGLRYWFEAVQGSGQGTKREHLREYIRRYPGVPVFLVGDSRFDVEAGTSVPGVLVIGRASSLHGWALTPDDLKRWGAVWSDYTLSGLPEFLEVFSHPSSRKKKRRPRRK